MNAPWDTCFVFDDIDDVAASWERIYNDASDLCCPWQEKKVRQKYQAPWITRPVLDQFRIRDSLVKTARRLNTDKSWDDYRVARNEAVTLVRRGNVIFTSLLLKTMISTRLGK